MSDDVTAKPKYTERNGKLYTEYGFMRRQDTLCQSDLENEISRIHAQVEALGAHEALTECSVLLQAAKDKLADYLDLHRLDLLPK